MQKQIKVLQNKIKTLEAQLKKVRDEKQKKGEALFDQVEKMLYLSQKDIDSKIQKQLDLFQYTYLEMNPKKSLMKSSTKIQSNSKSSKIMKVDQFSSKKLQSLTTMEHHIKDLEKIGDNKSAHTAVKQKQEVIEMIENGTLTAKNYLKQIKKIDPFLLIHFKDFIKQKLFLEKDNKTQQNLNKIIKKLKKSLNRQNMRKVVDIKPQVQFQFNIQPNEKEKILIQNFDNAPEFKQKQLFAESYSQLCSLIEYYELNLLERKRKQLQMQLLPKKVHASFIAENQFGNFYSDAGRFYVLHMPKGLTFQQFHQTTQKGYQRNLLKISTKLTLLLDIEVELFNSIRNSHRNFKLTAKVSEKISKYKEDIQYLNSLKNMDKKFLPLPSYKITEQAYEFFSQNTDVNQNQLQIVITKAEGFEPAQLRILFEDQKDPRLTIDVKPGPQSINAQIKAGKLSELGSKNVRIVIKKKVLLFSVEVIDRKISLKPLENRSSFKGTLIHQSVKVEYQIKARSAISGTSRAKVQVMTLTRHKQYIYTDSDKEKFVTKLLYPTGAKLEKKISVQEKHVHKLFYVERTQEILNKLKNIENEAKGSDMSIVYKPETVSSSVAYYVEMSSVLDIARKQYYPYKGNIDIINSLLKQISTMAQNIDENIDLQTELQKDINVDSNLLHLYSIFEIPEFYEFTKRKIEMTQKELDEVKQQKLKRDKLAEEGQANQSDGEQEEEEEHQGNDLFFVQRTPQILTILQSLPEAFKGVSKMAIKIPEAMSSSTHYFKRYKQVLKEALNKQHDETLQNFIKSDTTQNNKNKQLTVTKQIEKRVQYQSKTLPKKLDNMDPYQQQRLLNDCILFDYKLMRIYEYLELFDFVDFLEIRIQLVKEQLGVNLFVPPFRQPTFDIHKQIELFELKPNKQQRQMLSQYPADLQFPHLPVFCQSLVYIYFMIDISSNKALTQKCKKAQNELESEAKTIQNFKTHVYRERLMEIIKKDQLRLEFYQLLGLEDYFYFIKARLFIISKEFCKL